MGMMTMLCRSSRFCCAGFACQVLLAVIGMWPPLVSAAEPTVVEQQTRTFKASVDGRERGRLVMLFTKRSDGIETVRGDAELNFNFVVYRYKYTSVGTETWKDCFI